MKPHHETHTIAGHGTHGTYITGYALAAVLTLAIFGVAVFHRLPAIPMLCLIAFAAAIQSFVHMWFFLHMFRRNTPVWNTLSFAFTLFVVAVLITGSLFILLSANYHMMPGMTPAGLP